MQESLAETRQVYGQRLEGGYRYPPCLCKCFLSLIRLPTLLLNHPVGGSFLGSFDSIRDRILYFLAA